MYRVVATGDSCNVLVGQLSSGEVMVPEFLIAQTDASGATSQGVHHRVELMDGRIATRKVVLELLDEGMEATRANVGAETWIRGHPERAGALFEMGCHLECFRELPTIAAAEELN